MKFVALITFSFFASGLFVTSVAPVHTLQPDPAKLAEETQQSAAASLVGEFRSSVSGYLWMKADEYIHGGVGIRQLTGGEKQRNNARLASTEKTANGKHEALEHKDETGVIPTQDFDSRVLWGSLERELKPYFDPKAHKHKNQTETAPLFRFMTWADPKFVSAYSVGAYVLLVADNKRLGRPIAFLREGVNNVPESAILHADLGDYLARSGQMSEAVLVLRAFVDRADLTPPKIEAEVEGLNDCYRWLILLYRRLGDREREAETARRCLKLFPSDPVAKHTFDPNYGK